MYACMCVKYPFIIKKQTKKNNLSKYMRYTYSLFSYLLYQRSKRKVAFLGGPCSSAEGFSVP